MNYTIPPEARTYATELELREVQAVGAAPNAYTFLEGQAVPYDTWADIGMFLECHAQGSFKRSTSGNSGRPGLPLLLFHDARSFPIGHAEEWTHDGGLRGVWRLNDSPEAQRAGKAANEGDLVGLSVGFAPMPGKSVWDFAEDWNPSLGPAHMDKVVRQESRLLEVSLTPTPAFVDAAVANVRSAYTVETRAAMMPTRPALAVDAWRAWREGVQS